MPPVMPEAFTATKILIDGNEAGSSANSNLNLSPVISLHFSTDVLTTNAASSISFTSISGVAILYNATFSDNDSTIVLQAASSLVPLTKYIINVATSLQSKEGAHLQNAISLTFSTGIDSTDKFPRLSDDSLLTLIQKQTFKYFWDFGHPISGCARERNTSADLITTGGTGFGIMAMIAAANEGFISRSDALSRTTTITDFYKNKCTAYHGAYSHWINGATGATIPFSAQDDGADLVETSYLMQGLLCARQYFASSDANETALRNVISQLWDAVDWNWFKQGNQNVLYWHWSPTVGWAINQKIEGWNEALIVYALAASSRTHPITKAVYDAGWARGGNIKNGKQFYDITLPLGKILEDLFSLRIILFWVSIRIVYRMDMQLIIFSKIQHIPALIIAIV